MTDKSVNILGSEWTIVRSTKEKDPSLEDKDGYSDSSIKRMVVDEFNCEGEVGRKVDLKGSFAKQIIRHEMIHAFLFESGLDNLCKWATEEMVDWLSIQFPKIYDAFKKVDAI